MSDLKGKNVVVAGGTAGIGLAVAKLAAEAGAKVWAFGRSQEYIDKAKKDLGGKVTFLSADIHDAGALEDLFKQVGTIDHLAGNATGANRTLAPFMEQTHKQFSQAFDKFWGYTTLVRTGVPFMSEHGSITLTGGMYSRKCIPGTISLSCVGSAVEALCRGIAPEIAPVRINSVAPGTIDTPMYDPLGEAKQSTLLERTAAQPIKRPGTPEEMAGAIIYLMTADYVTGINIDVDGGKLLP